MRWMVALAVTILFVATSTADEKLTSFHGRILRVFDGDTFLVATATATHRVRLWGVDAPELRQPQGPAIATYVRKRWRGVRVQVLPHTIQPATSKYSARIVAEVVDARGMNIGAELVCAGRAWYSHRYAPNSEILIRCAADATEAKRGVHADPNAVRPWQWRRQHRR